MVKIRPKSVEVHGLLPGTCGLESFIKLSNQEGVDLRLSRGLDNIHHIAEGLELRNSSGSVPKATESTQSDRRVPREL